jgi:hypothetical protein
VKENVNNVITIREADWPMLWRVSNASLDYTHGSSPLAGWPCVAPNGDAAITMPPASNPTGESSFDCSTPIAASNANAVTRPSPQATATPAPAADAQVSPAVELCPAPPGRARQPPSDTQGGFAASEPQLRIQHTAGLGWPCRRSLILVRGRPTVAHTAGLPGRSVVCRALTVLGVCMFRR